MKSEDKIISVSEAAEILHISSATILNWVRSGIIQRKENGINSVSVHSALKKILSGELNRLNNRANKRISAKSFSPKELSVDLLSVLKLNEFLSEFKKEDYSVKNFIDLKKIIYEYPELKNIETDFIYQSIKSIGNKSKEGSYFTPDYIISGILDDYKLPKGTRVYDPCCGTGRFLTAIAKKYGNDVFLYGNDTDEIALGISDENLKNLGLKNFQLVHSDSLKFLEPEKFDFIFTNPPWGAHYSKSEKIELNKIYQQAGSCDSFEYFLLKGFISLKQDGIMSYILPESFLYVKRFEAIRKFLLENTKIIIIKNFGKAFSNVFSDIIRIDIKKCKADYEHKLLADNIPIRQSHFKNEPDHRFNIEISEEDRQILERIYKKPYDTLKNQAKWSLGIVTGDNNKYVIDARNDKFSLEVITGKNVDYFSLQGEKRYLINDFSKFQQVAKTNYFNAEEKLIYKFISNKLVFAFDKTGIYTLNSANVLIPELKDYPIKVVMAILNSDLINFIYRKRFRSLKVLRSSIEQMPFPKNPDKKIIDLIERKTNRIINNERDIVNNKREIEELVYKLYEVNR